MRKIVLFIGLITVLLLWGCAPAPLATANPVPNTGSAQQAGGLPTAPAAGPTQAAAPTASGAPLATQALTPTPTLAPVAATLAPAQSLPLAVTEVDTAGSLVGYTYSGLSCRATYTFEANISTIGAGTLSYYWLRSDGTSSKLTSLTFNNSDFQKVTDTWTIASTTPSISGSDQIVVVQPSRKAYTPAGVNVYCAPPAPTKRAAGSSGSTPPRKP